MSSHDDALLAIVADSLDDIERTRIAAENRLRHLTRSDVDEDGRQRDLGLPLTVPAVHAQAALVEALQTLEHQAILALKRQVRTHPLGPWIKATVGVGEKQGARLLAAIGDPYWNTLHDRPRTVSELWAYSGLHVLRTSQAGPDAHEACDGADSASDPTSGTMPPTRKSSGRNTTPSSSHEGRDSHGPRAAAGATSYEQHIHYPLAESVSHSQMRARQSLLAEDIATDHSALHAQGQDVGGEHPAGGDPASLAPQTHEGRAGVAPRRQRGQKVNWSTTAKSRTYVIAESCIKHAHSPYRPVYDNGRVKYLDATHGSPCNRCGPAGKPAAAGTPLSAGHQHARAMRLVMKELLKDLWRESRRLHGITDTAEDIAS